jgi:hypothetical protein
MIKTIIRKILGFFKHDEQEEDYQSSDDGLLDILNDSQKILDKTGDDLSKYDTEEIIRRNEYERQKSYKIKFEFIPSKQAFKNVRSYLQFTYGGFSEWKSIRDYCEKIAGGKCVICGGNNFEHNSPEKTYTTATECHEHWLYLDRIKTQKVYRLSSVCVQCHNIIHINMFSKNDDKTKLKFRKLIDKYCELNEIELEQALKDFEFAVSERNRRKYFEYWLDLSLLEKIPVFEHECKDKFNPHSNSFNYFIENTFKKSKGDDDE